MFQHFFMFWVIFLERLHNSNIIWCEFFNEQINFLISNLRFFQIIHFKVSYENAKQSTTQSPLVIQHPLFGRKENHSSLGRMISHLTKRTVVIPDARNHGNSPKCENPSIKQMSSDLINFQNQLKIKHSCLLGFSSGGRVAMMTALLQPQSGGRTSKINRK